MRSCMFVLSRRRKKSKVGLETKASKVGSSLMSETYSSLLQQGLDENELLYDALQTTTVDTTFPTDSIGRQVQTAATLKSLR